MLFSDMAQGECVLPLFRSFETYEENLSLRAREARKHQNVWRAERESRIQRAEKRLRNVVHES